MPISLIILKCFGSVHPSAVTNIKYFSTSGGGLDKQTPNKSVFIKPSQHNRFFDTDNKTEYCRTFGKWRCLNCSNTWSSAYTWISLAFCLKNKDILKNNKNIVKEYDKESIINFDGSKLKDKDFLIEKCKKCNNSKNLNVKIISYSNLEKGHTNLHIPHREDLCVKCQKGFHCKKYFSTLSISNTSFYSNSLNSKRYFSSTPQAREKRVEENSGEEKGESKSKFDETDCLNIITKKELKEINKILDSVKDTELFKIAFTHKSCCNNNNKVISYETLEFLGDSIIEFFVARFLYTVYKNYNEGDLTKLKSLLVCTKNLAELSKKIELNKYLNINVNLSKENQDIIRNKDKTLADIFEAFISVLYLEKGEDILIKFLILTIFNCSITKEKINELKKIFLSSNSKECSKDTLINNFNRTKNLNSLACEAPHDIVIPFDKQLMNQITLKFENINKDENQIKLLLDENNKIIFKELLLIQTRYDQIISNLKLSLEENKNANMNIIDLNNNILKELKYINEKNIFKQIEIINKCIDKLNINILELHNKINKLNLKLYIIVIFTFMLMITLIKIYS